jgi:hypothetical protein
MTSQDSPTVSQDTKISENGGKAMFLTNPPEKPNRNAVAAFSPALP